MANVMILTRAKEILMSCRLSLGIFLALFLVGFSIATEPDNPPSLSETIDSLEIEDGFQIRLIAQEPLITDPISCRLDMHGRLWVIEMADYPSMKKGNATPNGKLKVLTDLDCDGQYESATVFAGSLDFPTGVQPYKNGAIVTLAGKIVFIEDKDGDLVGDEIHIWFDGFAEQNQQLRANHPTLAPNGLIYVANGLRGGQVQAVHSRFDKRSERLDLRDGDFFFDPEGGAWGAIAGKSQYGLTIDDFGRRIGCSNRNPAMHAALDLTVIQRDPLLTPKESVVDVAKVGVDSRVYPRGNAWTTSNLHGGQFSAACGVFAPGWMSNRTENLFVCEPTAYLVQRQTLVREGSRWFARRTEKPSFDFLTSVSDWFRPVDLSPGVGESFYVVDMARKVIEHPDFMPPELKNRKDQRDGSQLGRIWQVVEGEEWPETSTEFNSDIAIDWLQSKSVWQRSSASQFFLEQGEKYSKAWESLLTNQSADQRGKSRAAFLLNRFGLLDQKHIDLMLTAEKEDLRVLGLHLSRSYEAWMAHLPELVLDQSSVVLLELSSRVAGASEMNPTVRIQALTDIALNPDADELVMSVVGSVAADDVLPLAESISSRGDTVSKIFLHLIERSAMKAPIDATNLLAVYLSGWNDSEVPDGSVAPLLTAWHRGLKRSGQRPTEVFSKVSEQHRITLREIVESNRALLTMETLSPSVRSDCLELFIATGSVDAAQLRDLASELNVFDVRKVAISQLLKIDPEWTKLFLSERWLSLNARLRHEVIRSSLARDIDALWILEQLRDDLLPKNAIEPKIAQRLREHPNREVASMAKRLLAPNDDRKKVIAEYQTAMNIEGDPFVGKKIFSDHCSACHRIDGYGTNVGPDISDTRTKSAEYLLTSILDPNAAIDASFVQTQLLTTDGRRFDGLLVGDDAENVTIQQQGGEKHIISKVEIEQVKNPGISLMPEGFERTISSDQMRDLISYLKNWRYMKVDIPGVSPDEIR